VKKIIAFLWLSTITYSTYNSETTAPEVVNPKKDHSLNTPEASTSEAQELPDFAISQNFANSFQERRKARKSEREKEKLLEQVLEIVRINNRLEELEYHLKKEEQFAKMDKIRLLKEQDSENLPPLFHIENFDELNTFCKKTLEIRRFFTLKAESELKKIKEEHRRLAEIKRYDLIKRLKEEIKKLKAQKDKYLKYFNMLKHLLFFFPTNLDPHFSSTFNSVSANDKSPKEISVD
jgi:hypothetical protein